MHDTHAMTGVAGMMRDGSKGNIGAIFTGALEALVLVPTRNCVHVQVSHQLRQYFANPTSHPSARPGPRTGGDVVGTAGELLVVRERVTEVMR